MDAIEAMVAIDPDSPEAQSLLPLLVARLKRGERPRGPGAVDRPTYTQIGIAKCLAAYGPSAAPIAWDLASVYRSLPPGHRRLALPPLAKMGRAARPALPILADAVREELKTGTWSEAVETILTINPASDAALSLLVPLAAAKHRPGRIGASADWALNQIVPHSKPAMPALRTLEKTGSPEERALAAEVLKRIESQDAPPEDLPDSEPR